MVARFTAPYGSWKTPVTAELIAAGTVGFGQLVLDGSDLYWSEMRPAEGGRNVIVRRSKDGEISDVLPPPFNARTRVHEYGGGALGVHRGQIFFSNFADQRLYGVCDRRNPEAITAAENARYADVVVDPLRRRLVCVREDHSSAGEPVNSIVGVDLAAERPVRTLTSGFDFFAAPRLSPDAMQLAWLAWNHPNMPWDGTELWLADVSESGMPRAARRIAGGANESIFQPAFSPDGTLYFVSDRTGWWNLYRYRAGSVEPMTSAQAEFGLPQWVFAMSTYAFESAGRIVCAYSRSGCWRLGFLDTETKELETVTAPYTDISGIVARPGEAFFLAGSPTDFTAIVRFDLATAGFEVVRRSTAITLDPGYCAAPQPIAYATAGGSTAHGFYYPPCNRDYRAPTGEKPPLLVLSHGGPTSATRSSLDLKIQYWSSRGFAVLDVNYRGSTGYGRGYRQALDGQWGVCDVDDCVQGAHYLVARGLVDEARLAIRGGSAGGYTTLCALVFHDVFKAGASYYGVSDLEALARDTHKFESHYLDRLIGPYPAKRDLYRARSPIHHADRLSCPVIFFQGLEDKVVPPDQTERMVTALRARGLPVAYVPFPGEQHGFRRAETIRRALEAELYFYSRVFQFTPAESIEPVEIENL